MELFSNWEQLCKVIANNLDNVQKTFGNSDTEVQINKLCNAVRSLYVGSETVDIYIFGSRLYGLAAENSDVDLYLDIGKTFNGKHMISNMNNQDRYIRSFARQCNLKSDEFQKIEQIFRTRVPIIKFYHVPTKLNCDVSFKSGLSYRNSKLIEYILKEYLSMDYTVKWLVYVVVKYWAIRNNLKGPNEFTSYALVWLVLFYLMTENVVPPLFELRKLAVTTEHIEGWDCTFGKWTSAIKNQDRHKLLMGFFQYYEDKQKLKNYILCTNTGKCMSKLRFFVNYKNLPEINEIQRLKFGNLRPGIIRCFEQHSGLAIQDPFDLASNLTRKITGYNLDLFCNLCNQTAIILHNTKFL